MSNILSKVCEVRQQEANFLTPTDRPRCSSCKQSSIEVYDRDRPEFHCKKLTCRVSSGAICKYYERKVTS